MRVLAFLAGLFLAAPSLAAAGGCDHTGHRSVSVLFVPSLKPNTSIPVFVHRGHSVQSLELVFTEGRRPFCLREQDAAHYHGGLSALLFQLQSFEASRMKPEDIRWGKLQVGDPRATAVESLLLMMDRKIHEGDTAGRDEHSGHGSMMAFVVPTRREEARVYFHGLDGFQFELAVEFANRVVRVTPADCWDEQFGFGGFLSEIVRLSDLWRAGKPEALRGDPFVARFERLVERKRREAVLGASITRGLQPPVFE